MDDQVLVGVLHCGADGQEQRQPLAAPTAVSFAEDVDRLPLDVLHDEIREAVSVVPPSSNVAMFG